MGFLELEFYLDKIFKAVNKDIPRSIYVNAKITRILRRYRPKPNRAVRTFKLRKHRKTIK